MHRYPQIIWGLYILLLLVAFYLWQLGWWLAAILFAGYLLVTVAVVLYKIPQLFTAPAAYVRYLKALRALRQNNDKQATQFVEQALALAPRFALAYALRASLHLRDERASRALDDCNAALAIAPHLTQARLLRTMALARVGKVGEARQAVAQTRFANRTLRGTAALYAYDYETAYRDLKQAYRWHRFWKPDSALLNNLGVAALHTGRIDEAWRYLRAALDTMNTYFASANLGYLLANEGQTARALGHIDNALEQKPDYHHAWGFKAYTHWLAGDYEAAFEALDEALAYMPEHLPHQALMVATLYASGDETAAQTAWHDLNDHKSEALSVTQMAQRYNWHPNLIVTLAAVDDSD